MSSSNQSRRGGGAGGTPYSTLIDAGNYLINKALGKKIPPKQQAAWDSLTSSEKKIVSKTVEEELPTRTVDVAPVDRLTSIPSGTRSTSGSNPPPTSNAGTNSPPRSNPPSPSTSLGRRIAESLMETFGDKRPSYTAMLDAMETKELEEEREMNVAGRKKGGMVKKKKAPVKKAYGGMVKKKQGGSARKVNMKAGFTRRGCSKG